MNNDYRYENRKFVIVGIVIAIVAVFIGRLFSLQILSDDYKKHADSNAFLNKTVYPSRGVMYDRTGKLLVSNQPAYHKGASDCRYCVLRRAALGAFFGCLRSRLRQKHHIHHLSSSLFLLVCAPQPARKPSSFFRRDG